MGEKGYSWWID